MTTVSDALTTGQRAALTAAALSLRAMGAFGAVELRPPGLWARARDAEAEAWYRIEIAGENLTACWCTPDRYLSQSIEAELTWTHDDLDDMLDEELDDVGWNCGKLTPLKHYRDDEQLFVFRAELPIDRNELNAGHGEALAKCLLGFNQVFQELGDMQGDAGEK